MCNLHSFRKGPAAILDLARAMRSDVGNHEPRDIYPDYPAPIVRQDENGDRVLTLARWGMPSSRKVLLDAATKTCRPAPGQGQGRGLRRALEDGAGRRDDERPQHYERSLEAQADPGASLPRALHGLRRARP